MTRAPFKPGLRMIASAVCTTVVLAVAAIGPFAPSSSAAPKTTKPPKTVAKKSSASPTTAKKNVGKKPTKQVRDSVAGRDKFCDGLFTFRAKLAENTQNPAYDGATTEETISRIAAANELALEPVIAIAHLPILKWAATDAAETYIAEIGRTEKKLNPADELDAVVAALVADGVEGFFILNAYAHLRCNFSMFIYDFGNLDAGPTSVTGELADGIAKNVASLAKAFPPAPPKGKKWPRASLFVGEASPVTPSTTAP